MDDIDTAKKKFREATGGVEVNRIDSRCVFLIGDHEYFPAYTKSCDGSECRATIVMAKDVAGRYHPFDEDTGHSHYATCPDAQKFRKEKK